MTGTGILIAAATAKRLRTGAALAAICAMLSSCAGPIAYNDFDTKGGISKKDYEDLLARRGPEAGAGTAANAATPGGEPPIPGFQSVVAAPAAPELADTRRVSIAVTETTPVRDILIELSRKSGVDLEMDPRISGGVIMTATDRPFVEVVERIAELAELRVKFERNTLRVEIDDPYMEQYQLDVLNQTRTSSSTASSSTDAQSASAAIGGSGGGGSNKSDTSVNSNSTANFWGDISENIGQILGAIQTRRTYATSAMSATFVPASDAVAPAAAPAAPAAGAKPAAPGLPGALGQALGLARGQQSAQAQIDANVAQALGTSGDPALPTVTSQTASSSGQTSQSTYSVNPQSGIVTVFANMRQQRAVERYLRTVRAAVTQQILIEAKILEVSLDDQYRAGIDWNALLGPNNDLSITGNFNRSVVPPTFADPTISAAWGNQGGDLDIAAQLVNQFGTVRTLSNPRLTVVNNQVAMLKVARNQVFFEIDVTDEENEQTNRRTIRVNSQIKTIPVGLVMSVQPAVDARTRQINLSMRPSITRITGFVDDPGVALQMASINRELASPVNVTSQIPIIETREIDSVLTLQSGQTIVMGGLMQEDATTNREGLPGLMDVPLVGQALSQNIKENRVTELVIFIRATLANDTGTVSDEDIRLYKTFGPDPRPIVF